MNSYEFAIIAGGLSLDDDAWEDCFYEAGCDDALVSIQRGSIIVDFTREAASAAEAVESACEDVRRAGATILRIEPDPLASASDIAERSGLTRQAVSLYANGERGEDFPAPVACVTTSRPLWRWSEVASWLHGKGKVEASVVETARTIDLANIRETVSASKGASPALPSRYTQPEYYMTGIRRTFEPRFDSEPSRNATHRSKKFSLRPTQSMDH